MWFANVFDGYVKRLKQIESTIEYINIKFQNVYTFDKDIFRDENLVKCRE